jgi:hypothetical protein
VKAARWRTEGHKIMPQKKKPHFMAGLRTKGNQTSSTFATVSAWCGPSMADWGPPGGVPNGAYRGYLRASDSTSRDIQKMMSTQSINL